MVFTEKRRESRRRTRLRPGKLFREDGRFLCDCAVVERSGAGARVRSFARQDLPERLFLVEETEGARWAVRPAWTRGCEAGLRFVSPADRLAPDALQRLAGKYYALDLDGDASAAIAAA